MIPTLGTRHAAIALHSFLAGLLLIVSAASAQIPGRVAPIQHWCNTGWHNPHPTPESECAWLTQFSSVPTLFEQDQLFIGDALDVIGDGLRK